jgi:hypothetical protein
MKSTSSTFYRLFFKKESSFVGFILAGAVVSEIATDGITNAIWRAKNSGVK